MLHNSARVVTLSVFLMTFSNYCQTWQSTCWCEKFRWRSQTCLQAWVSIFTVLLRLNAWVAPPALEKNMSKKRKKRKSIMQHDRSPKHVVFRARIRGLPATWCCWLTYLSESWSFESAFNTTWLVISPDFLHVVIRELGSRLSNAMIKDWHGKECTRKECTRKRLTHDTTSMSRTD